MFESDRGRFRILPEVDPPGVALTNTGHQYLWSINATNANRQSYTLLQRSGGYVFFNAYGGGQWLMYHPSDDSIVSGSDETRAMVWNITPSPDPSLVRSTPR